MRKAEVNPAHWGCLQGGLMRVRGFDCVFDSPSLLFSSIVSATLACVGRPGGDVGISGAWARAAAPEGLGDRAAPGGARDGRPAPVQPAPPFGEGRDFVALLFRCPLRQAPPRFARPSAPPRPGWGRPVRAVPPALPGPG